MARRPEPEEEDDDIQDIPPSSPSLLKQILRYAMLGFAPLVAVVALAIAIVAVTENRALQEKLDSSDARMKKLTSALSASLTELKRLRIAQAQEKNAGLEADRKQDELTTKVIQNLAPLQTRLKIHPTLEEQLRQAASASAVSSTANAASAPVAAAPAAPPAAKKVEPPHSPQVKTMLEEIKKFNQQ